MSYDDGLTPTGYLIMEVLAARHRLGEQVWTFPRRYRGSLKILQDLGLVGFKSGVVEQTDVAWLTDEGRSTALSPTYVPSGWREVWGTSTPEFSTRSGGSPPLAGRVDPHADPDDGTPPVEGSAAPAPPRLGAGASTDDNQRGPWSRNDPTNPRLHRAD